MTRPGGLFFALGLLLIPTILGAAVIFNSFTKTYFRWIREHERQTAIIFIGICGHALLPFHCVLLLVGEGNGYYTSRDMLRFTVPLSALLVPVVLVLYLGWWQIIGLL